MTRIIMILIWKTDIDAFPIKTLHTSVLISNVSVVKLGRDDTEQWILRSETCGLLSCLKDDSPQLIQTLRDSYIEKPAKEKYNLTVPVEQYLRNSSLYKSTSQKVDEKIFNGRIKDGFFIEAGGKDFEEGSTSLYFELKYNWTGLLVEPLSQFYDVGVAKNRKVYSVNACLSPKNYPSIFTYSLTYEGLSDQGQVPSQCIPLYSLLLACGSPTVNYFSLDIEGHEFQVLKTIPWDKVDIQVMNIETHFVGERSEGSRDDLIKYLADKGYVHLDDFHQVYQYFQDFETRESRPIIDDIFVRKDIYHKYYLN